MNHFWFFRIKQDSVDQGLMIKIKSIVLRGLLSRLESEIRAISSLFLVFDEHSNADMHCQINRSKSTGLY